MNNYIADRIAGQLLTDPYGGAITDDNARDVRRSMPRRVAQAPAMSGGDILAQPSAAPAITVQPLSADSIVAAGLESPRRTAMPMARPAMRTAAVPMARPQQGAVQTAAVPDREAAPAGSANGVSRPGQSADSNQSVIAADNSSEVKDSTDMTQGTGNPPSLSEALQNNAQAADGQQQTDDQGMPWSDRLWKGLPILAALLGLGAGAYGLNRMGRGGQAAGALDGEVIPPTRPGAPGAAGPGINQTIDATRRQSPSGVVNARLAANPRAAAVAGPQRPAISGPQRPAISGPQRPAVAGPAPQRALPAPRKALPAPKPALNTRYAGNSSQVYGKQSVTADGPVGKHAGVTRTTARGIAPGTKKPALSKDRVVQGLESPKRPVTKRGKRNDKKASSK